MLYGPGIIGKVGGIYQGLNPYFFGKCSTAFSKDTYIISLNVS